MINQQEPGEQEEEKEKEEEVYPPGSPPMEEDFIQFSEAVPQEDYYHHPPMSKACCEACKRRDKNNGKSCVCVVPANQRKVNLKEMGGCRTCGCNGCTREDQINAMKAKQDFEEMRNGCCKACMKAFNKVGPNGTPLS